MARDDEFHKALTALDDAEFRGVALVGDSGVGKSTLAHRLAKAVESSGRTVRFALGTQTGSTVPLSAFSRAVSVDVAHEPAFILAAAHKTLDQDENLVVVVDDAHLLDPLSATLVYQLAASRSARLIVTLRFGDSVLDAVTALLKERLLVTVHLDPFTREQTAELVHRVLGGAVESRLIEELYDRSGGNPLLLHGLLSAGRESGILVDSEDGWQLRGRLRADSQLYDLLELWLRSLDPEELEAVEVLATGELLDWEILRGLCDAEAVGRLERRGLIQLVADGSDTLAQLRHPVFGEAAIRLAGVVRSRQLNGMLAQALQKHLQEVRGRRSRLPDVRGQIRLAHFMTRSDLSPDLEVIISAAASAVTMSSLSDGEELARFACDRGGGLPAAIVLAEAISWQGRGDEAEVVLRALDPGGADEFMTMRWGCLRAANLFWACGEVDPARQVLAKVKDLVGSEASIRRVAALEVSFAFFSGDLATAIQKGPALCESDVLPSAAVSAAVPTCWALALAGRFDEVRRIADMGLRAAALSEFGPGPQRFTMGIAEVMALTAAGDYPAAEQIWERYAAMAAGVPEARAMVDAIHGLVHLARGALPSACAAFHDSMSTLSRGFLSAWLMLISAWLAQAEGTRGNADAAAAALRRSEQACGPQVIVFLPEIELARAWERASAGQTSSARKHAVQAAQIARRSGMYAVEMRALHTAVRFGDRFHAARLRKLAEVLNTPMAEAVAAHARGLADHDGDLLDGAAARFVDLGALALAADAAAHAAREHARSGHGQKELESSTRAYWLAHQGKVRTPAVKTAARPLPISDREREIAMLVAAGLSNRQIAERLSVSVRTVDGHLYRMFAKLGITRRDQLVELVSGNQSRPDTRLQSSRNNAAKRAASHLTRF